MALMTVAEAERKVLTADSEYGHWRDMPPCIRLNQLIAALVGYYADFSQDLNVAVKLWTADHKLWLLCYGYGNDYEAEYPARDSEDDGNFERAVTPAHAICRAFLAWREREDRRR